MSATRQNRCFSTSEFLMPETALNKKQIFSRYELKKWSFQRYYQRYRNCYLWILRLKICLQKCALLWRRKKVQMAQHSRIVLCKSRFQSGKVERSAELTKCLQQWWESEANGENKITCVSGSLNEQQSERGLFYCDSCNLLTPTFSEQVITSYLGFIESCQGC